MTKEGSTKFVNFMTPMGSGGMLNYVEFLLCELTYNTFIAIVLRGY